MSYIIIRTKSYFYTRFCATWGGIIVTSNIYTGLMTDMPHKHQKYGLKYGIHPYMIGSMLGVWAFGFMKGIGYGIFMPITLPCTLYDIIFGVHPMRHFIPNYGNDACKKYWEMHYLETYKSRLGQTSA